MTNIDDFIRYKEFISEEFCIFRKSDEYFPIYLVAKKGGDTYEINVNYPQGTELKTDVEITEIASFRRVKPETLYTEVQSKIVELIKSRKERDNNLTEE